VDVSKPSPGEGEVLVKLSAAALNHRDLFIRQHQYPSISFTAPLFADGAGTVIALGPGVKQTNLLDQRVVLSPSIGWASDPRGPESPTFTVVGSSKLTPLGTGQEYVCLGENEVELAPPHLSPVESASLPLCGLTAWRALCTKSESAVPGHNILITGIGGGVALMALQFAAAKGCNAYVTSSDPVKLERARELGARGGVSYKSESWEKDLQGLLPPERPFLDAVIDGAGGDVVARACRLLKPGGIIAQYGMTVSPKMDWSMAAVLRNIELRGTTMGSRKEFAEMVAFVRERQIRPVVSRVIQGFNLEAINELFDDMKVGRQFGKLVIEIEASNGSPSRL
jgi:NADPH:quinone reductase-like Zn-dependent oxidoreductase